MDYIINGSPFGPVANELLANGFDLRSRRPFIANDGKSYVTTTLNGKETAVRTHNATATLRYDEWKQFDDAVLKASRQRLRAVADLRGQGLTYSIPNGMGKTVFVTEKMSDPGNAAISMDGLRAAADDRPIFEIENLPLPIISSDFSFSARQLATSRNGNTPLDTVMAEAAARRVAEEAERLLIGTSTLWGSTKAYGGGYIYGYTSHPDITTVSITAPTTSGWTGETLLSEILEMIQGSLDDYHYGPWALYFSPGWARYLGEDFKAASDKSVIQRIREIDGLTSIRTLDYLTNYGILLVQMTSEVVREVVGMDFTTVQWETTGGLEVHFKVMAIMVPQIRSDFYDRCGIVYGS